MSDEAASPSVNGLWSVRSDRWDARSRTLALALEVINGAHGIDTLASVPLGDFRKVDIAGLRVAVVHDDGVMTPSAARKRADFPVAPKL